MASGVLCLHGLFPAFQHYTLVMPFLLYILSFVFGQAYKSRRFLFLDTVYIEIPIEQAYLFRYFVMALSNPRGVPQHGCSRVLWMASLSDKLQKTGRLPRS